MKKVIGAYKNGNYKVMVLSDGTKIRSTMEDDFKPSFAENCDVKITDRCTQGCPFCYEGCTNKGFHGHLMNPDGTPYWDFLNELHPYTELALNGNDVDHPELEQFLKFLKTKKVFANITVNQKQFEDNLDTLGEWVGDGLIKGLGISVQNIAEDGFLDLVSKFPNAVLHTIAGLLSMEDLRYIQEYQEHTGYKPKVLVLGYKTTQRGDTFYKAHMEAVERGIMMLRWNLDLLSKIASVVSFDNLALKQLSVKDTLFNGREKDWEQFYMGDDGGFTFYLDLVKGTYSKNSTEPIEKRYNILKHLDDMFKKFQK